MILQGKSVAHGVAVGRVHIHNNSSIIPKENFCPQGQEQVHLDRYNSCKLQAIYELDLIIHKLKDDPKADIFKAHKEIVDDVIINEEIPVKIKNEKWAGDWAIYQVYETVLGVLKKTPDPLISERASDFEDVRDLLLRLWHKTSNNTEDTKSIDAIDAPVILAARELLPSSAANMDKEKILAIVTETGSLTTHAAIIAKSYGIPTVMGVTGLLDIVKNNQMAVVDAAKGEVIIEPSQAEIAQYQKEALKFLNNKKEDQAYLLKEGRTKCGLRIDIGLNIANADKDLEAEKTADSVGVFRTEFLYMSAANKPPVNPSSHARPEGAHMGRKDLPTEEEQYVVYRKVLECFGEKPVIIRTLDIGGDKKLASINLPQEENPFLGVRALRFCFTHPDIFKTQIKAALRAGEHGNLWLMFPMVGSIEDIRKVKEYVAGVQNELKKEGKEVSNYKIGIMIEIPSIALVADLAAKEVDFASIGSNDLCQYLCAADRMNHEVSEYYQAYHPGMLKLLKDIITAFNSAGKPISICGEMGGDAMAVPLLIGLGLRKLSMNAGSIARVKRVIAGLTVKQCEELAEKALACSTAEEVKKLLVNFLTESTEVQRTRS